MFIIVFTQVIPNGFSFTLTIISNGFSFAITIYILVSSSSSSSNLQKIQLQSIKFQLKLSVKSEINFERKKFGVVLYTYHVECTEIYNDGKLIIMINERINKKNFFLSKNEILAINKKLIFIHILI